MMLGMTNWRYDPAQAIRSQLIGRQSPLGQGTMQMPPNMTPNPQPIPTPMAGGSSLSGQSVTPHVQPTPPVNFGLGTRDNPTLAAMGIIPGAPEHGVNVAQYPPLARMPNSPQQYNPSAPAGRPPMGLMGFRG